jgi:hypothetical protein
MDSAPRHVRGYREPHVQPRQRDRSGVQAPAVATPAISVSRRGDAAQAVDQPHHRRDAGRRRLRFQRAGAPLPVVGGYIRNCALRAAFLAAHEGRPLAQSHLVRAFQLDYREIGKAPVRAPRARLPPPSRPTNPCRAPPSRAPHAPWPSAACPGVGRRAPVHRVGIGLEERDQPLDVLRVGRVEIAAARAWWLRRARRAGAHLAGVRALGALRALCALCVLCAGGSVLHPARRRLALALGPRRLALAPRRRAPCLPFCSGALS